MATDSAAPDSIHVKLFASYADRLGRDSLDLPAGGIRTAGDLLDRIRALPGGAAVGATALIAVNLRQAGADTPVSPMDEIALLPPLAGG